ncbi:MAG: hypothetical protein ABIP94_17130, partial [Planctomycetota bacterium]
MQSTFPRSLRRLSHRSTNRWVPLSTGGLLVAWLLWLLMARVTIYAVSDASRLEVEQAVCPVEAGIDGRVTATHIVLDAEVHAGQALVVFDSQSLELERNELNATRASREARLAPLAQQIEAIEGQIDDLEHAAGKGNEEQDAGIREAEAALLLANRAVARLAQLGTGLVSDVDLEKAQTEVDKLRAGLERQRAARERSEWDRRAARSELRATLAESRRQLVEMQGECAVVDAKIQTIAHEIERCTIRAPIDGVLGETADVRPGQFVARDTRLAAI